MKKLIIIFLFIMMLINITCKKSTDSAPCSPYTNISETDATGRIYGNTDTDDWQPSGILTVYPAYPNPSIPVCTIEYTLSELAYLRMTVNKTPDRTVRTLIADTMYAGNHKIIWDAKDDFEEIVSDCIYRIYISATKDGITYQTYGDIKLEWPNE